MGVIDWLKNPDGTQGKPKNYVFGCNRGCAYCYGRRIAKRFGMAKRMAECEMRYEFGKNWDYNNIFALTKYAMLVSAFKNFIPTFRPSVLAQKLPRKPTMIFFSMSDPAYWEEEWYKKILEKIKQYPQHTFVVLTKSSEIYRKYIFPPNCWLGVTIENEKQLRNVGYFTSALEGICTLSRKTINNKTFLSIEPIQSKIEIGEISEMCFDWIIVGPETGRRKNKIIAQPDWIEPFYDLETRVFMKEACKQIIDKKLRQEWPKGYMNEKNKKRTGNI